MYSRIFSIVQLIAVLAIPTSSSERHYGETCAPLSSNPDLKCAGYPNIRCTPAGDGTHKCLCASDLDLEPDNRTCTGTFNSVCLGGDCSRSRRLSCQDMSPITYHGQCKCYKNEAIWDGELRKCVGRSGSVCSPSEGERTCIEQANCDSQTETCICESGFESDNERRCVRQGGMKGSPCTTNDDCDWAVYHLECQNEGKVCGCAEGRGYIESKENGNCVRPFGETCNPTDICDSSRYQKCNSYTGIPGTCVCKLYNSGLELEYNAYTKECASLLGYNCGEGSEIFTGIGCVRNAECAQNQNMTHTCRCLPGFLPTIDRRDCVIPG